MTFSRFISKSDLIPRKVRVCTLFVLTLGFPSILAALPIAKLDADLKKATETEYSAIAKSVRLSLPFTVSPDGLIDGDAKHWIHERDADNTDLFTSKKGDARIAVLKDPRGIVESVTTFSLKTELKETGLKPEADDSLIFRDRRLVSRTTCDDVATKTSPGRSCLTVTAPLCKSINKKDVISPETLRELDVLEMKALAVILTLRGPDHQLDNVVRFGNRLGLKTAGQTTKGQLILASRLPASTDKANETVQAITRLKDLCKSTSFSN